MITKIWGKWLKIAEFIGNVQMGLILFICYWTLLAVMVIPVKLISDPLILRKNHFKGWHPRDNYDDVFEWMRKQG